VHFEPGETKLRVVSLLHDFHCFAVERAHQCCWRRLGERLCVGLLLQRRDFGFEGCHSFWQSGHRFPYGNLIEDLQNVSYRYADHDAPS